MAARKRPPKTGSFIAWKKGFTKAGGYVVLIKLRVPARAQRVYHRGHSNHDGKFRVSEAKVVGIYSTNMYGKKKTWKKAINYHHAHYKRLCYRVGKTVKPDRMDLCKDRTCSNGIHCFMSEKTAREYLG